MPRPPWKEKRFSSPHMHALQISIRFGSLLTARKVLVSLEEKEERGRTNGLGAEETRSEVRALRVCATWRCQLGGRWKPLDEPWIG